MTPTPAYAPFDPAATAAAYRAIDAALEASLGKSRPVLPDLGGLFADRNPAEVSVFFCRYLRDHLLAEERLWGARVNHRHVEVLMRIVDQAAGF